MTVYTVEILGPSKRRFAIMVSIMYGVGYILISGLVRDYVIACILIPEF